MGKLKKYLIYFLLSITLITVGCEGGCQQESPTQPEKSITNIIF